MAGKSNEIKHKIVLEGEKEYSSSIKTAQRNVKTLQSALKAETAELGKNATEQQKAAVKTKNLQQQIAEQEKVVQTLRAALKEVQESYADNADEIQYWERRLNDARTTLANMKNSLTDAGGGFVQMTSDANSAVTAANSVADSLERMGKIGDSISGSIEKAFTGAIHAVGDAVGAVWGQITDLAARSNNLVDLAGYWNTDVTMIQKYSGAVGNASANLQDLNSLVTKINSVDEKKIAELTGVSGANYEDRWQYAMAVMDALSKMDTKTRNAAGFEIFGKGATKMFDLANDWDKVLAHLEEYDPSKGGFGLTEEQLQSMSDLYDKVNGLKASWQALKDMGTVELFGSLAMDLTGNAQAILDSLLKYFNAEDDSEREAALSEMEANIVAAFERVGQAIEEGLAKLSEVAKKLSESDNPAVAAVGNIMGKLVEALEWLTEDNMKNAVSALEILAGFWIAGKGLTMISKVGQFAASLGTLRTWKMSQDLSNFLSGGGGNGTPTAPTGTPTTPTVVPTGTPKGGTPTTTPTGTPVVSPTKGPSMLGNVAIGTVAFAAAHEVAMGMSADTLTKVAEAAGLDTTIQKTVDEFNKKHGIVSGGDLKRKLLATPQAQTQKTLDFIVANALNTSTSKSPSAIKADTSNLLTSPLKMAGKILNPAVTGVTGFFDRILGFDPNDPNNINLGKMAWQGMANLVPAVVGNVNNASKFWGQQFDNTGRFWSNTFNSATQGMAMGTMQAMAFLENLFGGNRSAKEHALDEAGMREEPKGNTPAIVAEGITEMERRLAAEHAKPGPEDSVYVGEGSAVAIVADLSKAADALEEIEDVMLDDYTDQQKNEAIQDWWMAWKNADQGLDSYDEEYAAWDHLMEVFGEDWNEMYDRIIQHMGDTDPKDIPEIPASWWQNAGQNGITQSDISGLRGAVGTMGTMVYNGAYNAISRGLSGISVNMDGATVGRLVAPYVSRNIAYMIN